ncbi:MAG: shikimate dehydrogenase [Burkholderiales bacterium]|nr:shikimate dehydrogenase [Phycisphaerae bacterium]
MTHLCVSIYVNDLAQARRDVALAAERGADMVELRVDTFTDEMEVRSLVSSCTLPCIVTCRSRLEGGQTELDDVQRLGLLTAAGEAGASYLDIEFATMRDNNWAGPSKPRDQRPGWIYSAHDFQSRPLGLNQLIIDLAQSTADIAKVAWQARSVRDNIEAFELMLQRHKPSAAICMSEPGMISRILAKKFGAFVSFASLDSASATAPGQVTVTDLKQIYRWDAQRASTRVYGVVGQPIAHSMSPAIHNRAFDHVGFDGVYVPFLIEGTYESFKAFMETFLEFQPLMLGGLSVTIPHKENALRYLQERGATIEPLAELIGAVNTVIVARDGDDYTLHGQNTDYAAILDAITDTLSITRDALAGRRVAVIGAGGTGRTAVAALARYGADVTIYNRSADRADALAKEFDGLSGKVAAAAIVSLGAADAEIFINTTSVGMHPNVDASPFDSATPDITESTLVFDTIYNPLETKLLRQARQRGARTIAGIDMFVRQAAAQFEAWTGIAAPADVMRDVVISRLEVS